MIRFALILLMSLALSSQAVALVTWDHSGEDSVQKATLACEKGDYGTALQILIPVAKKETQLLNFTWQRCIVKEKVFPKITKLL